eukprot:scaffold260513_cov28-Tisochrysis_lutea.AAC.1
MERRPAEAGGGRQAGADVRTGSAAATRRLSPSAIPECSDWVGRVGRGSWETPMYSTLQDDLCRVIE